MPKQRITKEMIVETAFSIARENGMEQVLVKKIAEKLGCSVQPIYSYFDNMEALRQEVTIRTKGFFQQYIAEHMDPNDMFRSTGFSHLHLAKEEPHLFKLYFLRKRPDIHSLEDLYTSESNPNITRYIADTLGLSMDQAKALHLHMILYSMGIGSILATTGAEISIEEMEVQLDIAYKTFLTQIKEGDLQ